MYNPRRACVLKNPQVNEQIGELVKDSLAQRKTLLAIGNCWVTYRGRASSSLEPGERIVIIKEDGSLLVHRPTGFEAVNWQPPGCIFQSTVKDNVLIIKAIRRKPMESIHMHFDSIILIASARLKDTGMFSLHASEREMQKAILMQPSMLEAGFRSISFEKKVEPGFVDIYGIDKNGKFVVVEIKRGTASKASVLQLSRYVKAVQRIVNREVRGLLVAPRIAKGTQKLLFTLGLGFKPLDPKKCASVLLAEPQETKLVDFFDLSK
ncbi:MAG: endonuclease NucS [Candidatus Bathyarchaeota archaeon]|nr:endonuclease NucS [Candidatus Bathyarchaeota archaeon]